MNECVEEIDNCNDKFIAAMDDVEEVFQPIAEVISEFSDSLFGVFLERGNRLFEALESSGIRKTIRKVLAIRMMSVQIQHGKRVKAITMPKRRNRTKLLLTKKMLYNLIMMHR